MRVDYEAWVEAFWEVWCTHSTPGGARWRPQHGDAEQRVNAYEPRARTLSLTDGAASNKQTNKQANNQASNKNASKQTSKTNKPLLKGNERGRTGASARSERRSAPQCVERVLGGGRAGVDVADHDHPRGREHERVLEQQRELRRAAAVPLSPLPLSPNRTRAQTHAETFPNGRRTDK